MTRTNKAVTGVHPNRGAIWLAAAALAAVCCNPASAQRLVHFDAAAGVDVLGDSWPHSPQGVYVEAGAFRWLSRPRTVRASIGIKGHYLARSASLADTSKHVTAPGVAAVIQVREGTSHWEFFQALAVGFDLLSVSRATPGGPPIKIAHQTNQATSFGVGARLRLGPVWLGVEQLSLEMLDPFDTRAMARMTMFTVSY